jgi:hypothetical protein
MRRDWVVAGALLLAGLCLALPFALSEPRWYTDSLYYEAQKLELMGSSQEEALREVFTGEQAAPLAGRLPMGERRAEYAEFYRRRWAVPALAAALDPAFGVESLRNASLLGWAVLPPLLFLLLQRRFSVRASVVAACAGALLPPLVNWAPAPLVDSWGLSMLVAALLCALLAREDARWLPAWVLVIFVASLTRDIGLILVLATGWLALRERSRRMALIAGLGALASLPVPLLFSAPLQDNLAYVVNGFQLPAEPVGWGWILERYPGAVLHLIADDLAYPFEVAMPYSLLAFLFAVPVLAGLWLLFRAERTPAIALVRAAAVAALTTLLLSPNYTGLRLELVFVPAIAAGLALLAERLTRQAVSPPGGG